MRKPPPFKSESEMAAIAVAWLKKEGWEVYQEVQFGQVADIVAVKDKKTWVIECKLTFGLAVLEQACEWRDQANFVSIAVPYKTICHHKFGGHLVRVLNLGCLGVVGFGWNEEPWVHNMIEPPENDLTKFADHNLISSHLMEQQKTFSQAGNNKGERFTPFKNTVLQIEDYLKAHPGADWKEIVKNIHHHYSNDSCAGASLRKLEERGILKNIWIDTSTRPAKWYIRENKEEK
jgi:hypothetical protein